MSELTTEQNTPNTSEAKVSLKARKRVAHRLPTGVLGVTQAADPQLVYAACMDGVYELNLDDGESA